MPNIRHRPKSPAQAALRFTVAYVVFGGLWIATSDWGVVWVLGTQTSAPIAQAQFFKGWFYVLGTGGLAYVVLYRMLRNRAEAQQQAEAARDQLRAAQERLTGLLTASPTVLYVLRLEGGGPVPVWVSDNIHRITGFTAEEALAPSWWLQQVHPDDRESAAASLSTLEREGHLSHEYRLLHKDGSMIWLLDEQRLVRRNHGTSPEVIGTWTEITAKKFAEQANEEAEARHRRQRNALAAFTGLRVNEKDDLNSAFRQITETAARTLDAARVSIWRYTEDRTQLVCYNLFDLATGDHSCGFSLAAGQFPRYFEALAQEDVIAADHAQTDPRTAEFTGAYLAPLGITSMMDAAIRLGGTLDGVICHEHVGPPRQWTSDEKTFVLALANQVSLALEGWQRLQAELRLRAAQEHLQRAVGASNVGLWDWNIETNEVFFTPEARRQLGYGLDEFPDRFEAWAALLHPEDRERATSYAQRYVTAPAGPYAQEFRLRHRDGSYRWILSQGSLERGPHGRAQRVLGSHIDITERKRLEAEFLQAQKMESIGRLAGGVAHDFNNLLTVISGYSEMALSSLQEGEPLHRELLQIRRASERAANLTRQLLAFSRRQVLRAELLDLNAIVADAEKMLRRLIGEDIRLEFRPGDALGHVVADPGQIEQVIMNLVVNARDAMPTGGLITITTENVSPSGGPETADQHPGALPGPCICISVSDTGIGMEPEIQKKVFEPFFTTKPQDKGTGLGLATVYGIVKQSGGAIHLESAPGAGTTFRIYLPRVEQPAAAAGTAADDGAPAAGHETILLVEDEDALRNLTARVLARAGYKVLSAASAPDALALFSQSESAGTPEQATIHLLLTDVIMPGTSGPELARQLTDRNPALRVLYMSGYTDTAIAAHGVLEGGIQLLSKPFSAAQLTQKIREVLEQRETERGHMGAG